MMTGRHARGIGLLLVAAVVGWMILPPDAPSPAPAGPDAHTVYVVEHGWHAGLALARDDVSASDWAAVRDIPEAHTVEVGWGDAAFYQAADPGAGTLLKAGLWPTESVMHVAAFRRPVTAVFPHREIIRIEVARPRFERLLRFIRQSHHRDATGRIVPLGPGLYGDSQFYAATGRYHALHNCNTWMMRALERAGCATPWLRTLTVGGVLQQARACGTIIQSATE